MHDVPIGPGVYAIWNTVTGKVYVGSAMSIRWRWRGHRVKLKNGRHHSPHLQAAWDKYGPEAFELLVLDECQSDQLLLREGYWINRYHAADRNHGYNCQSVPGHSNLGRRWSQETKTKMGMASKARMTDPEYKARVLASMRDPETRRKNSECHKKLWQDPESRERYLAGHKKRAANPQYRVKMSATQLKRYADPEIKAKLVEVARRPDRCRKISDAAKKLWTTPEHRAKIAAAYQRPEYRKKISEATRKVWTTPEHRAKIAAAQQRPEYQLKMKATKAARKQQRLREFRERLVAERRARGWVS